MRWPKYRYDSEWHWFGILFLALFFYQSLCANGGDWLLLVAAMMCLVGTRIAEIIKVKISASGFEAEMASAVQNAQDTVRMIHNMAKEQAKIMVDSIHGAGRWGGKSEAEKHQLQERITDTLSDLGLSEEQIQEINDVALPYIDFDYSYFVTTGIDTTELSDEDRQKWNDFFDANIRKGIGFEPSPDELETFLNELGLLEGDVVERLNDYSHFKEHRTHRRPEVWFRDRN